MSQPVNKVPMKEMNNHKQGRSGGGVIKKPGPAKGRGSGNPTAGGGIVGHGTMPRKGTGRK